MPHYYERKESEVVVSSPWCRLIVPLSLPIHDLSDTILFETTNTRSYSQPRGETDKPNSRSEVSRRAVPGRAGSILRGVRREKKDEKQVVITMTREVSHIEWVSDGC